MGCRYTKDAQQATLVAAPLDCLRMSPNVLKDHPSQQPWIGSSYASRSHRQLMWVAESVKLPPNESIERSDWYTMTDNQLKAEGLLTSTGIKWISISDNIARGIKTGKWPQRTYRRIDDALKAVDPELGMDHVRFANFFLRPAPCNGNLVLNQQDIDVARSSFLAELDKDLPDVIVISSKRAACHVRDDLQKRDVDVLITDHPVAPGHPAPQNRPELNRVLAEQVAERSSRRTL